MTIDVKEQPDRPEHPRITYLSGSSTDPDVFARVGELLGDGKPLIVLDSSHRRRHVLEELRLWSPLVPVGSYIVVEDTHAGGHPVTTRIGRGPWAAVKDFLRRDRRLRGRRVQAQVLPHLQPARIPQADRVGRRSLYVAATCL